MNLLSYTVVAISLTKMWRERKTARKNKQENAGFQSHNAISLCQFTYKILISYLNELLRNLLQKITVLIAWRERKDNKYKKEQTGQSRLSIPRYNLSLLFCLPNMDILSYIVAEISLTKNVERKKKGDIQGRINRRMSVLNPTMQQVIVNLHTKY